MKQKTILTSVFAMIMLAICISFVACSPDSDSEPTPTPPDPGPDPVEKQLSPASLKIISELEGTYDGSIRLTYRTYYNGNYGKEPYYPTNIKITKQSNGLYSAYVSWNDNSLYFYNVEAGENDKGEFELKADDCYSDMTNKDWWFVLTVLPNFSVELRLFCHGPITENYLFTGTKPYSNITNNVSVNSTYRDYAYTVDFVTSLSNVFPGKTIKYGIEMGYDSYDWQMYAQGSGSSYSVTSCVFINGSGSPYSNLGYMYSTYVSLKNSSNLNANQRGLLSDIQSEYKKNESTAKNNFKGRAFVEIGSDRYFIKNFN